MDHETGNEGRCGARRVRPGTAAVAFSAALALAACTDALGPQDPAEPPAGMVTTQSAAAANEPAGLAAAVDDALGRLLPALQRGAPGLLAPHLTALQASLETPDRVDLPAAVAGGQAAVERYAGGAVDDAPELDGVRLILERAAALAQINGSAR